MTLALNPTVRLEHWYSNDTVSVHRGALMYSLPIKGNYTMLNQYAFESRDYQVLPLTEWRYALQVRSVGRVVSLSPFFRLFFPLFSLRPSFSIISSSSLLSSPWALFFLPRLRVHGVSLVAAEFDRAAKTECVFEQKRQWILSELICLPMAVALAKGDCIEGSTLLLLQLLPAVVWRCTAERTSQAPTCVFVRPFFRSR